MFVHGCQVESDCLRAPESFYPLISSFSEAFVRSGKFYIARVSVDFPFLSSIISLELMFTYQLCCAKLVVEKINYSKVRLSNKIPPTGCAHLPFGESRCLNNALAPTRYTVTNCRERDAYEPSACARLSPREISAASREQRSSEPPLLRTDKWKFWRHSFKFDRGMIHSCRKWSIERVIISFGFHVIWSKRKVCNNTRWKNFPNDSLVFFVGVMKLLGWSNTVWEHR